MARRNYYEVLKVTKDATGAEIKSAYRRLAHQFHPDKNPGDKAAEDAFKDVSDAYEMLSDTRKRRVYDLLHRPVDTITALFEQDSEGHKVMERELPRAPATARPGADRAVIITVSEKTIQEGGFVTIHLERKTAQTKTETIELTLQVPPGHHIAHLPGLGDDGINGGDRGNLYVILRL